MIDCSGLGRIEMGYAVFELGIMLEDSIELYRWDCRYVEMLYEIKDMRLFDYESILMEVDGI
jgi:hypothetical protein